MACHNLCSILSPPPLFRTLLGLGLSFCPIPTQTTGTDAIKFTIDRFRKDIHTKMFFADATNDDWMNSKQLFIRSDWAPDTALIPAEFRSRVSQFLRKLQNKFTRRRVHTNLTPYQKKLLATLRDSEDFLVIPTDKNLGPAIIERSEYTRRAFEDHLNNEATYRRLTPTLANKRITAITRQIQQFIENQPSLPKDERTYLTRSLSVKDPFAYFYLTAKVHKIPWKTRPIVSISGSITHGLGRWLDKELQPICRKLSSFISSSFALKKELASLSIDPSRARFFTADAVSMYTNIDTDHALPVISNFLRYSSHCSDIDAEPIICALELIMRNNMFKFGDTYWLQTTGTAMGTPPACMYAILYYGIHELNFYPRFQSLVPLYKRYIDDVIGLWIMDNDPATDARNWAEFKEALPFGKLTWEFSERDTSVNFLDLTLTLDNHHVVTRLFEKPLNLYLYIPPHSAHPPGILRGMIYGYVTRVFRLTSKKSDCEASIRSFYRRLCDRGYSACKLRPLFHDALKRAQTNRCVSRDDQEVSTFLHLNYHPNDPPSQALQQLFREILSSPQNEPPLHTLCNLNGAPIRINRMIVAYRRPRNLKNLLFPRHFREALDAPASSFARATLETDGSTTA
jgi:DNA-binding MarR family transcriptional regulator